MSVVVLGESTTGDRFHWHNLMKIILLNYKLIHGVGAYVLRNSQVSAKRNEYIKWRRKHTPMCNPTRLFYSSQRTKSHMGTPAHTTQWQTKPWGIRTQLLWPDTENFCVKISDDIIEATVSSNITRQVVTAKMKQPMKNAWSQRRN